VWAGLLLVSRGAVDAESFLFYAFSATAITSGGLLVTQRNPARAALSFALVVLSTCGLFLLLAAPFLMAATIIIYAGAIIVTFVFVIMLAQQSGISNADQRSREPLLSCIAGFVLLAALLMVLNQSYNIRALSSLLDRTETALSKSTADEIASALGEQRAYFDDFRKAADDARVSPSLSEPFEQSLTELEVHFRMQPMDVAKVR